MSGTIDWYKVMHGISTCRKMIVALYRESTVAVALLATVHVFAGATSAMHDKLLLQ
jgi:hypothetical protein